MKKTILTILAALTAAMAFGQTPEEVITRMGEEMDKHEKEGLSMVVDVKVPIVGTLSTKMYALGDKARMEAAVAGIDIITWVDKENQWEYNTKTQEVIIRKLDPKTTAGSTDNMEMFDDIADGYDVSIASETPQAWTIRCKKQKTNKDKDAPKTIDLVVAKGTYLPISLSTSMMGVSIKMHSLALGVTDSQVTFNAAEFPDATIDDRR